MDKDLPFYFWTLNDRFSQDDMASFDEIPDDGQPTRLHRLKRRSREDTSIVSIGRNVLPAKQRPRIRDYVYKHDIGVPPVPVDNEELLARARAVFDENQPGTSRD